LIVIFFSNFSGIVKPKPENLPKDGIPWTTLLYGVGPGYDWGKRLDINNIDTSKYFVFCTSFQNSYRRFLQLRLSFNNSCWDVSFIVQGFCGQNGHTV